MAESWITNTYMQKLQRYPLRKNELLQAWDSADELLLDYVRAQDLKSKKILICNDQFGALGRGLKDQAITVFTDSFISSQAIQINSAGQIVPIYQWSQLSGCYDYILIRIPKNLSYFEDFLCHLTQHLQPGSKIICGSMVKHLAPGSFDLLQKYIGSTSTGLAVRKARLVFADFEKEKTSSPYPLKIKLDGFEQEFIHHSNLFSREKLDIGTRFLLANIPQGDFVNILDLGCANGVVGIRAKQLMPQAKIIFSDESYMAIQSARINYQNHFSDQAQFHWTNCYADGVEESLDLVLCNPPFHQNNTIGDFIAWQMFTDAHRALRTGGLLRIIGNNHLGYLLKLKTIFGNGKIIASNNKFMIVDAIKSRR